MFQLAYSVDDKKLREVFRLAGRVISTELNRDKEGKSRGHGVVEFSHPVEAVQAISMFNSQNLYERAMTVSNYWRSLLSLFLPSEINIFLSTIAVREWYIRCITFFSLEFIYIFLCFLTAQVRFDKQPGPTPEELDVLPSRLPEGLEGVGMGLGSGGNPLTNVAQNLPSAQDNSNNSMGGKA